MNFSKERCGELLIVYALGKVFAPKVCATVPLRTNPIACAEVKDAFEKLFFRH